MERPNIENYKLGKGIRINDFVSDLILYIDQEEAEKKELQNTMYEVLTEILKLPMCQEVGYLQEAIKAAANMKDKSR